MKNENSILVTGGAGFIGKHLVKKLLSNSQELGLGSLTIVDNLSGQDDIGSRRNKATIVPSRKYLHFYKEDIRNKKAISNIIKDEEIDTCIHLAALTNVASSIRNPNKTMDINVIGTLKLLESCSLNGVKNFIFASSAAAYGKATRLPIRESLALQPISPYGVSKVAGEALVTSFKNMDRIQNVVSLRMFNVYGHNQNPDYADVITVFARRLNRGLPPIINGDGMQTRDFISISDAANCIVMAVKALEQLKGQPLYVSNILPHHVFNVGTGVSTSVNELARVMIEIYGYDLEPVHTNETCPGEVRYSYADTKLAERYLHFRARQKLESGLKEIANHAIHQG